MTLALFSGSASLLGFLFCYLLPAYNSFKALRSGSRKAVIKLLMHWTVVSLFAGIEVFADVLVGWLPLYSVTKFLLILWLTLPQTQGAIFVYRHLIHTQFVQHEAEIDTLLAHAHDAAWMYADFLRARAVHYGKQLLVSSVKQGHQLLLNQVNGDSSRVLVSGIAQQLQAITESVAQVPSPPQPAAPAPAAVPASDGDYEDVLDEDQDDGAGTGTDSDQSIEVIVETTTPPLHLRPRSRRQSLRSPPRFPAGHRRQSLASSHRPNAAANTSEPPFTDADIAEELALANPWNMLSAVTGSSASTSPVAALNPSPLVAENAPNAENVSPAAAAPLPPAVAAAKSRLLAASSSTTSTALRRMSSGKLPPLHPLIVTNRPMQGVPPTATARPKHDIKPAFGVSVAGITQRRPNRILRATTADNVQVS